MTLHNLLFETGIIYRYYFCSSHYLSEYIRNSLHNTLVEGNNNKYVTILLLIFKQ